MRSSFFPTYVSILVVVFLAMGASGCGEQPFREEGPLKYKFLSKDKVDIVYKETTYRLDRNARRYDTPFKYQFESDGDIDITVNGKTYDLDSPFDITRDKKKPKKVKKKKSSKSSKKAKTTKEKKSKKKKSKKKKTTSSSK